MNGFQVEPQYILTRVDQATLLPFMPEVVLKNLSRLLKNMNIQTFDHLIQLKRPYTVKQDLVTDIQAAILFFVDILLKTVPNVNLHVILDQVTDFLTCPVEQKHLRLALSILQTCKPPEDPIDFRKFTHLAVNQIFRTGGLHVDCLDTAEVQLAVLNVLYRFSREYPQFLVLLCEDSDVVLTGQDARLRNVNKARRENLGTTKVVGDRIVDPDDAREQLASSMRRQDIGELEPGMCGGAGPALELDAATLEITEPRRPRNANFVQDYLVRLFQEYGRGGYHSARDLVRVLRQVRAVAGAAKTGVLEGHAVNYQELNRTRVRLMDARLAEYKQLRKQQLEDDERELEAIYAKGQSMQALNELVAKKAQMKMRDRMQARQLQKAVNHDMRFSYAKERERDEGGEFLGTIGLETRLLKTACPTGTDYGRLQTTQGPTGLPAANATGRISLPTETAVLPPFDPEAEAPHESLFVLYGLLLLRLLLETPSPARQLRLVLRLDGAAVDGVLSFVNTLPDAALAVVLAGIGAGRAEFAGPAIVEYLDQLVQGFNPSGARFIAALLERHGERLGHEFVEGLAERVCSGLAVLALQQTNQLVTEQCLGALAGLACAYAARTRRSLYERLLPYLRQGLAERMCRTLAAENVPVEHYVTAVLVRGLFGLPRTAAAAQAFYDSGLYKAVLRYLCARFGAPGPAKLQPSDVVLLRALADCLNDVPEQIRRYTQQRRDVQGALCQLYRQYARTLDATPVDARGVLLGGAELREVADPMARADLYRCAGGGPPRAVSPAARRALGAQARRTLSPARSRANIALLQTQVRRREFDAMRLDRLAAAPGGGGPPEARGRAPAELRYLLGVDLTSTVLAVFRALYPGLVDPGRELRPLRPGDAEPALTGRAASRPATGQTPQIGLRLPAVLPQLNVTNQGRNRRDNAVLVGLQPRDFLVLLQLLGTNAKAALAQLDALAPGELAEDDRRFVDAARARLEGRIAMLQDAGGRVADALRNDGTVEEAQFYARQGADEE